jgi:hypothetical protein
MLIVWMDQLREFDWIPAILLLQTWEGGFWRLLDD